METPAYTSCGDFVLEHMMLSQVYGPIYISMSAATSFNLLYKIVDHVSLRLQSCARSRKAQTGSSASLIVIRAYSTYLVIFTGRELLLLLLSVL